MIFFSIQYENIVLFLPKAFVDEQWKRSMDYLDTVSELNYLTQIVIMLYEDSSEEENSEKRFHVELHFSPGAYDCFDVPLEVKKSVLSIKNFDKITYLLYRMIVLHQIPIQNVLFYRKVIEKQHIVLRELNQN